MKKIDMERSRIGCPMMKVKSSQAAIVVNVERSPEMEVVPVSAARAGKAKRTERAIDKNRTFVRLLSHVLRMRVNKCFIKHLLKIKL